MNKIKKKWYERPAITLIVIPIILTMFDWLKEKPFLYTLKSICVTVFRFFQSDIKIWHVLLGALILLGIWKLIVRNRKTKIIYPNFYNYNADRLKKWRWSWNYEYNNVDSKWVITELIPHCPGCDTRMLYRFPQYLDWGSAICPRCNKSFNGRHDVEFEDSGKIEALIFDNIQKGQYVSKDV